MKLLSKTRDEESRPGNRSARKNRGEKKACEKESCVRKNCWSHRFLPMGSAIGVSFSLPFAMTGKQKEKQYQVSNHPPDSG
jgi:hypothetical protein